MQIRLRAVGAVLVVAATALFGVAFLGQLPARVAIHFGPSGRPDDYVAKAVALALVPALQVALYGFFALLPRTDPLGENLAEFRTAYDGFVLLTLGLLGYVHALIVLWNVGYDLSVVRALVPAVAVVYYAAGAVTKRAARNWFVGFRTPWTLSNERVWDETHAIGGRLLQVAAVLTLGGLVLPAYAVGFMVGPAVAVAAFTTVYSYWEYRRVTRAGA